MKGGVGHDLLLGHFTLKPVNVIGTGRGVSSSSDSCLSLGSGFLEGRAQRKSLLVG